MRATPRSVLAALGTAAVIASSAVSATPAFADASTIRAYLPDVSISASGGSAKTYTLWVSEYGPLSNAKVTIDFGGVDGIVTPSFPDSASGCAIAGSTATCTLPDKTDADEAHLEIPLTLVPAAGAKDGVTGSFIVVSTADGVDQDAETTNVTVKDGPDLVLPASYQSPKAAPGDHVTLPITVENAGSQPANGVVFEFAMSHGVQPDAYDNCLYADWPDDDGTLVLCEIDGSLAPGMAWKLDPSMSGDIPADSANSARVDLLVDNADAADARTALSRGAFGLDKSHLSFSKRSASKSLTATQTDSSDVDFNDNYETWDYQVDTAYDMVADGAKVVGTPGDVVKVKLGSTDNGPASIDFWSVHDFAAGIEVAVPEWADVVGVPANCLGETAPESQRLESKPGYRYYACTSSNYFLRAHDSFSVTFSMKIKSSSGKDGSVALPKGDAFGEFDTNHANDVASITLAAPDDGSLPVTGAKAGLIGGIGGGLLLIGGALLFLGRRRKRATAV